jgi:hypothetical protein
VAQIQHISRPVEVMCALLARDKAPGCLVRLLYTLPAPDCACSCGEIQYEPSGFEGGGLRGVHLRGPPGSGGDRAGARGACGVSCGVAPRLGGPPRGDARWEAHSDPAWPMRCGFEVHIGRRRYRPGREHGSTPKYGQVCALAGQVLWLVLLERPPSHCFNITFYIEV